jgi:hypothetical protein
MITKIWEQGVKGIKKRSRDIMGKLKQRLIQVKEYKIY